MTATVITFPYNNSNVIYIWQTSNGDIYYSETYLTNGTLIDGYIRISGSGTEQLPNKII